MWARSPFRSYGACACFRSLFSINISSLRDLMPLINLAKKTRSCQFATQCLPGEIDSTSPPVERDFWNQIQLAKLQSNSKLSLARQRSFN
jgi:hypothetical protein